MDEHVQPLRRIQWRARVLAAGGAAYLAELVARGHREETLDDRHDPDFESWLRGDRGPRTAPGVAVRRPEHAEQWLIFDEERAADRALVQAAQLMGVPPAQLPAVVTQLQATVDELSDTLVTLHLAVAALDRRAEAQRA